MANRRTFLKGITGIGLTTACVGDKEQTDSGVENIGIRAPEPSIWSPEAVEDVAAFPRGVQVGDALQDSAIVHIHTTHDEIEWVLVQGVDDAWVEVQRDSGTPVDGLLRLELTGLQSDAVYSIIGQHSDGGRSRVTRFRTALGDSDWRIVTFGASSCLGGNVPWPSLSRAAEERYDFFMLLGDTVYTNSTTVENAWQDWWQVLGIRGMAELTSSTSVIATWDDHELVNNFDWSLIDNAETIHSNALYCFHRAMPNRSNEVGGIYRSIQHGEVLEIFVLDCRGERRSDDDIYISEAQMNWLKDGLSSSTARFKMIMNSVPITDMEDLIGEVEAIDRWQGFASQRTEILSHIEENDIPGVLWISGDFHFGFIAQVGRTGEVGDSMMEVLVGPTGSFINIMGELLVTTEQYQQALPEWCHTRFECNPQTGEVFIQYILDDGSIGMERRLELL